MVEYRLILPPLAYILKTAIPFSTVSTPRTQASEYGCDGISKDSSCPAQNQREAQEKAQWQAEPDWERLTSETGLIPECSVTLTACLP